MSEQSMAPPAQIGLRRAAGLTLTAAIVGWGTDRIAVHVGWHFPSAGYLAGEVIWKLVTLAIMALALWRYEGLRLSRQVAGFGTPADPTRRYPYPILACGLVLAAAFVLNFTVGQSASNANAYGKVHAAGAGLILGEILIRYPLTSLAEEAFFRGWLQPRLGPNGPVLSAVLWGGYHLQQVSTIPFLVLFGLVFGAIRWKEGHVRTTAIVHYAINVIFFLTNYT